jgi:hypothetical protein
MLNLAKYVVEAKILSRHNDMLEGMREAREELHWRDPDNGDNDVTYCPQCGTEEADGLECDSMGCRFNAEEEIDE